MLVLKIKPGGSIMIGDSITLTLTDIITNPETGGRKVKLGIDAPIEIPIHRREVAERIAAEGRRNSS